MVWQGKICVTVIAALVGAALIVPAVADPPPWAPAHGWRAKHGHDEDREGDHEQDREEVHVVAQPAYAAPYGIAQSTCYRSAVGALIGAGAGAYAGNQIGKGSGKIAATIGGGILGAIVGGAIGNWMDQADQGCVGQVLEHGQIGQAVRWSNPDNGAQYTVTPVKSYQTAGGGYCREDTAEATVGGSPEQSVGAACRQPDCCW